MKKSIIVIALALAMVFAFAGVAMADHSPQFYFNFQAGAGVTSSPTFIAVFPTESHAIFSIDNGSWALGTASPHKGYSQTTAKCGVCHQVHRAPTRGTSSTAAPTVSSRYTLTGYTALATPDTQLLLKSTANGACGFCHIVGGHADMYGGDITMAWVTGPAEESWNEFYGHTNGCVSCHAVHGAYTLPNSKILKYQGVKSSGTFALIVQPELYGTNYVWDNSAGDGMKEVAPIMWASKADMVAGNLTAAAVAAGVTLEDAAVTANCSICHANYSGANNATINFDLRNAQLFQGGAWANANGNTTPWVYGVSAGTNSNSFSMMYKNHPMKAAAAKFSSPGASGNATAGSVSAAGSWVCQSCHNAPTNKMDGQYVVQSFPHYTPGYYKFMAALDQGAFATPSTKAEVDYGRIPFYTAAWAGWDAAGSYNWGKGPAIMNDGYCTKCHTQVGVTF